MIQIIMKKLDEYEKQGKIHDVFYFYFLSISFILFYFERLKGKEIQRDRWRERARKRDLPSIGSLCKRPQWPIAGSGWNRKPGNSDVSST